MGTNKGHDTRRAERKSYPPGAAELQRLQPHRRITGPWEDPERFNRRGSVQLAWRKKLALSNNSTSSIHEVTSWADEGNYSDVTGFCEAHGTVSLAILSEKACSTTEPLLNGLSSS